MKAFVVTDEYGDGCAVIAFAEHAVAARRDGANELGADFGSVSCRRARWADAYAPGPVPTRAKIEEGGWWVECACGCGERIDSDTPSPFYAGDNAWPSVEHHDQDMAERARLRAEEEDARAVACAAALRKFPWATIEHVSLRGSKPPVVTFRFDGGVWPVSWEVGANVAGVCPGDIAAFRALCPEPISPEPACAS